MLKIAFGNRTQKSRLTGPSRSVCWVIFGVGVPYPLIYRGTHETGPTMGNLNQTTMMSVMVMSLAITGCTSLEPLFVPQGTVVDAPATIKVSMPKSVALSAAEQQEVRLPVSKVGTLDVHQSELLVVMQLDPIARVARAHARSIAFGARDGHKVLDVDGFLIDGAGIAEFSVKCKRKRRSDDTDCDAATLEKRDDVLEVILLHPIDLGGTTLMAAPTI